jgi:UDP-glucose 6-dehydrogenase
VNTFADYITQEAKDQRELLASITDPRFMAYTFDAGVGYIASAFPKQGLEFCFNQNPDTGKYVAYLIDHANEKYLDFIVEDLDATRESVVKSFEKAYEYIELNNL